MVDAYSTFSGFGLRALHVGRQKIPVVRTQAKNNPSNDRSRSTRARYISAGVGSNIMSRRIRFRLIVRYRKLDRQFPAERKLMHGQPLAFLDADEAEDAVPAPRKCGAVGRNAGHCCRNAARRAIV